MLGLTGILLYYLPRVNKGNIDLVFFLFYATARLLDPPNPSTLINNSSSVSQLYSSSKFQNWNFMGIICHTDRHFFPYKHYIWRMFYTPAIMAESKLKICIAILATNRVFTIRLLCLLSTDQQTLNQYSNIFYLFSIIIIKWLYYLKLSYLSQNFVNISVFLWHKLEKVHFVANKFFLWWCRQNSLKCLIKEFFT